MEVNEIQKRVLVHKIKSYFKDNLKGKKIAIWGIAFKPNTDDIREAPALYIMEDLLKMGALISAYDPEGMPNAKKIFNDTVTFVDDPYHTLEGADALCILTEWSEFRTPDFEKIKSLMKSNVIFDGRNVYDLSQPSEYGFYYNSIGRQEVKSI